MNVIPICTKQRFKLTPDRTNPSGFCPLSLFLLSLQEWWTHLWLNEGFASWIEYLCVDHCFPEYDIWTQFVSADYTRAQELDALDNSHPIEVNPAFPPFFSLFFWKLFPVVKKGISLTEAESGVAVVLCGFLPKRLP